MIDVFWYGRFAQRDQVVEACERYLTEHCSIEESEIVVELITEVDDQISGCCYGDPENVTIVLARRSEGEYYTRKEILRNLSHELIHAKQIINGEIDVHMLRENYEDQPWEVEAYSNEDAICEKYFKNFLT